MSLLAGLVCCGHDSIFCFLFAGAVVIEAVEDAMVSAIKIAPLGYKLGIVSSYGGELSGDENAMALLLKQFPACWVAFSGESEPVPYSTAKSAWSTVATFTLFVATKSARGEKFSRHSAGSAEVGAYRIAKDLRTLFVNQDLGLAIQAFKPGAIKSLFNKKLQGETVAVFAVELKCKYLIKEPPSANWPDWLSCDFGLYLSAADSEPEVSGLINLKVPV